MSLLRREERVMRGGRNRGEEEKRD